MYLQHPNFSRVFRALFPHISQPSILHLVMVTHPYCRSWQSVTSFVLQECGISAVLVRTLGLYHNAETFHFKFMNRIPNSGPNLKVTCKITPSKNSSHNFHTHIFYKEIGQKHAKITQVNTVSHFSLNLFPLLCLKKVCVEVFVILLHCLGADSGGTR
jgi:hypothetical protein